MQEAEAQRKRQRAQTPPRASRSSLLTTLIYFAEDGQLSDHIDMVHTLPTFSNQHASSEPWLSAWVLGVQAEAQRLVDAGVIREDTHCYTVRPS